MVNDLLTEIDILNYLMTSDFNEGLTQDESKFLLLKYRNYYRILYSKNEQMGHTIEDLNKKIMEMNENHDKSLMISNDHIRKIEEELKNEKSRKLTWKERIYGKKM